MAVVATISALVLGLLLSNANSSFNAIQGQVTCISAQILRLDQLLRRYGSETKSAREKLLQYAERKRDDLFPKNLADFHLGDAATYELLQEFEERVLAIKPSSSRDQMVAGTVYDTCGQDWRCSLSPSAANRTGNAKSSPPASSILAYVVIRQLYAFCAVERYFDRDLCALAIAGAIGMILELERGFGTLVHVSPQPMNHAVAVLQAEASKEDEDARSSRSRLRAN